MSRGALYHHFAAKEELFEAVFAAVETNVLARVTAAAEVAETATDALAAGCKAWLRLAGDPVVRRIVLVDAPLALGWTRWRQLDEQYALGLLLFGVEATGVDTDLISSIAHALLALCNELALVVTAAIDVQQSLEQAFRTVDRFIGGLPR